MNRVPALVSSFGVVAVFSIIACSAKHEERPPILTECGSNDQACSGNGTGSGAGGGGARDGAAATDASVGDTGVATDASLGDSGVVVDDAGLTFDSGLGITD